MQLIKAISAKAILGSSDAVKKAEEGPIFSLIGFASGIESGESSFGPWEALVGEFLAVRTADGEEFKAGKAFPPATLIELVKPFLMDAENPRVQVAFIIGKKKSSSPVGYDYTVESMMPPEKDDPLMALKEATQKSLPAPAKKK